MKKIRETMGEKREIERERERKREGERERERERERKREREKEIERGRERGDRWGREKESVKTREKKGGGVLIRCLKAFVSENVFCLTATLIHNIHSR